MSFTLGRGVYSNIPKNMCDHPSSSCADKIIYVTEKFSYFECRQVSDRFGFRGPDEVSSSKCILYSFPRLTILQHSGKPLLITLIVNNGKRVKILCVFFQPNHSVLHVSYGQS
jgi:hypothetical protein